MIARFSRGGCRLDVRIRNRACGATEPVVEQDLAELRFVAGEERAFLEFSAEVACVCVGDHFAWIVVRAEHALEESVEVDGSGPPISMVPFKGEPVAILATARATSSAAIGWNALAARERRCRG